MKIILPSYEIRTPWGPLTSEDGVRLLRWIEYNGRISHRAEDAQTKDSYIRFIELWVMSHCDYSVLEHSAITIIFRVDRGVSHELVRHRLFGFTQESTRFVNGNKKYPEGLEFIKPVELKPDSEWAWADSLRQAEINYLDMLNKGSRPQEARSVLPNALATTIAVSGNLRQWRSFLLARTSKETHPDFRAVTIPLLKDMQRLIPIIFADIEPLAKQSLNLSKGR